MPIGCLFFPHFAIQVETEADKAIRGRPIIIGGMPHEKGAVFDASNKAIRSGVRPGMSLRQAYGLCPNGVFLPLDQARYARASAQVHTLLDNFSMTVEVVELGLACIDLAYSSGLPEFMDEIRQAIEKETHLLASLSCAAGKFTAQVAGRIGKPGGAIVIPPGEERNFLQGLPIEVLPGTGETLRQFRFLGIHTMGQLADLSRVAVGVAFGREGERLWDLANGIDGSRLIARRKTIVLENGMCFDYPPKSLDQLLSGADVLLSSLTTQLREHWQCCGRLITHLRFADGNSTVISIHLKDPTSSKEALLRYLKQRLDNTGFGSFVAELRLALIDVSAEKGHQMGLLDSLPRQSDDLRRTIRQLQKRYGKGIIKRATISERSAGLPERSFSFTPQV